MTSLRSALAPTLAGLLCIGVVVATHADADPAPRAASARAVAGAQTSGDTLFPHQGNGGYDVRHYDIALTYAVDGSIEATTTIQASTTGAAGAAGTDRLSEFSLDLEGLDVAQVTVDGAPAAYERISDAKAGVHKLVITPATPVSGDFTTAVTYSGTPMSHTDPDGSSEGWTRTASGDVVALNEPVGAMTWFPDNNTPRDKATYTTELTVPAALTAVSNGVLESVTTSPTAPGTRTFTWQQPRPQASYLALVAIGDYTAAESDVALSAGSTPEWSYANPTLAGSGFATARARLSPVLTALEGHYGAYPGVSTGVVVDNSSVGYALETQDRPYFESSIDRNTLIHELVHQWFGDAVSPSDWSDVWLNEGPATFVATRIEAELYDGPSTQAVYYDAWRNRPADAKFWTTPVAGFDDPADLFGSPTYERGAMALEALRTELGDRLFDEVMATWIARHRGGDASTAEWIALSEEISGRDLTAFFDDWLYDTDKPAWPERLPAQTHRQRPQIEGVARVGRTVRAVLGATDRGSTTTYQWYAADKPLRSATAKRFTITRAQLGKRLTVRTTTTKPGFRPVTRLSHPTPKVVE